MGDIFADIETWLHTIRRVKTLVDDRYIRDFKAPWHGINTEQGGVTDDYIPEDYAKACREALEGGKREKSTGRLKAQKDTVTFPNSGLAISWEDDNPTVMINRGGAIVTVLRSDIMDVIATLYPLYRPSEPASPANPGPGYGGVSSSTAVWSSNTRQDQHNKAVLDEAERIKNWQKQRALIDG